MTEKTDLEIIEEIKGGNLDAYRILYERHATAMYNLCIRYLGSTEEAEDAMQDVFVKAYETILHWEPRAQFKTWIYRIAINHCLNILRRRKVIFFQSIFAAKNEGPGPELLNPRDKTPTADDQLIDRQQKQRVWRAVQKLPAQQKTVILLYYYQQLSYKEIAEILNISLSSVESRIFRAKKSLAKILKKE
ncbi:MAG: RNA polymerase sigma factor SigW [Calditrichia bacterium]